MGEHAGGHASSHPTHLASRQTDRYRDVSALAWPEVERGTSFGYFLRVLLFLSEYLV